MFSIDPGRPVPVLFKEQAQASKMVQRVRVLVAKHDDLSSNSQDPHGVRKEPTLESCPLTPTTCAVVSTHPHTHSLPTEINVILKNTYLFLCLL